MKLISNGQKFYVENRLYGQISRFTTAQLKKKDNNKIFLVCGDTGVGKSAFAFQMAAACDPHFGIENIQFTTDEMKNALRTMHNKAIVFDEAFRGASGRNVMGKAQKELLEMFYEIRQLNQVVFLVAPSFFRLDEAIAVELSDGLFHISRTKSGRRAFRLFNRKKKDQLYYYAKRGKKSYATVPSMVNGNFPKTYIVSDADYREKKFNSLYKVPEVKPLTQPQQRIESEKENVVNYWREQEYSIRDIEKKMKEMGIPLGRSRIGDIVAKNPQKFTSVRPNDI